MDLGLGGTVRLLLLALFQPCTWPHHGNGCPGVFALRGPPDGRAPQVESELDTTLVLPPHDLPVGQIAITTKQRTVGWQWAAMHNLSHQAMVDLGASCWLDAHGFEFTTPLHRLPVLLAPAPSTRPFPLHQLGKFQEAVVCCHVGQKLTGSCMEAAATATGSIISTPTRRAQARQGRRVHEERHDHTQYQSLPLLLVDPRHTLAAPNAAADQQRLLGGQALQRHTWAHDATAFTIYNATNMQRSMSGGEQITGQHHQQQQQS